MTSLMTADDRSACHTQAACLDLLLEARLSDLANEKALFGLLQAEEGKEADRLADVWADLGQRLPMPSPENANPVCYDLWTNSIFEGANGSTGDDHGGGHAHNSSAQSERAPVTAPPPTTTREKKKGWFSK
jgi:hypothetical protein